MSDTAVSDFGAEEMESLQVANLFHKLLADGAIDTIRTASVELSIYPNPNSRNITKVRRFLVKTADILVTSVERPEPS